MQDLHHRLGQLGRNLGVWSVALMVRSFEFFAPSVKLKLVQVESGTSTGRLNYLALSPTYLNLIICLSAMYLSGLIQSHFICIGRSKSKLV